VPPQPCNFYPFKSTDQRRVYLHPQDLSVIDGYTHSIFGTFFMKRGALPRYHTGGLVTVLLSLRVYSDLI